MNEQNAVVAMYHTHTEAEAAIQAMNRSLTGATAPNGWPD